MKKYTKKSSLALPSQSAKILSQDEASLDNLGHDTKFTVSQRLYAISSLWKVYGEKPSVCAGKR